MNDMTRVIAPKSDQLNADDFVSGPKTFVVERVDIRPDSEQPVSIWLQGEKRPWKSCKSMNRVLVAAWGSDTKEYTGRSLTLYRDPTVKWGGMEVGGIRISHMNHIERDMVMALTATKGKRAPYTVRVLQGAATTVPERKVATFRLEGVLGEPFPKTAAGIAEAIETLEASDLDVIAANLAWLESLPIDRLAELQSRISALVSRATSSD